MKKSYWESTKFAQLARYFQQEGNGQPRTTENVIREIVTTLKGLPVLDFELAKSLIQSAVIGELSFDEWERRLDFLLTGASGVGLHDRPDLDLRDAYDDGISPEDMANVILENEESE